VEADSNAKAARWLEELGAISDESTQLTRTFLSPALGQAKELVARWMHEGGLEVFEDQAGNLIGRLDCENPEAGTVVCGSHLDTVRNAGKFDGALGVVAGVMAVSEIRRRGLRLPYHLEVVGFSDEEGVRFQTTYLGSRQYTGKLGPAELAARDENSISVSDAIATHRPVFPMPPAGRVPLGYVEVHIEQGPVLENTGVALGVATAIAGQTRARIFLEGKAGHAGTTPMTMRRDALAGAAECVLFIEEQAKADKGIVATVGELRIESAASNVIPGRVSFTLDVRDGDDEKRTNFCTDIICGMEKMMEMRNLTFRIETVLSAPSVQCSPHLSSVLAERVSTRQTSCPYLVSGAGHDAVAMAEITEVALLFVRCREGLSHHPEEYASPEDIALAVEVLTDFLSTFPHHE